MNGVHQLVQTASFGDRDNHMRLHFDFFPFHDVSGCLLEKVGQFHFDVLRLVLVLLGILPEIVHVAINYEGVSMSTWPLLQYLMLFIVFETIRKDLFKDMVNLEDMSGC